MPTKPTFVLVAGAFHSPECWDNVKTHLMEAGHEVVYATLASVGAVNGLADAGDDKKAVRSVIERVLAEGKNVALALHSYAGVPGSSACEGLGIADRQVAGFPNGIISITYIAAVITPKGMSCIEAFGALSPWVVDKGTYCEADGPEDLFYHDVAAEKRAQCVAKLKPHATNAFKLVKLEYEAFKYIPSTYLVCEDDRCMPAKEIQETLAASAGPGVMTVRRIKSGHSPFKAKPEETAALLRSIAGENM